MIFDKIWNNIVENKAFYMHLSSSVNIDVDMDRRVFSLEFSDKWNADPMFFILNCFRMSNLDNLLNNEMLSDEYSFIRSYLLSKSIVIPFSKREYSDYILETSRSSMILDTLERTLFSSDMKFVIPVEADAKKILGTSYEFLKDIAPDLFLYSGSSARCHIDIYERISGFSVEINSATIFIQSNRNNDGLFFIRSGIRAFGKDDLISVFNLSSPSYPTNDNFIAIDKDYTDSISPVSFFFSRFTIDSDSPEFMISVASNIYKGNEHASILSNGDEPIANAVSRYLLKKIEEYGSESVSRLAKILSLISFFPVTDKIIISEQIKKKLKSVTAKNIVRVIEISPDRISPKIRDIVLSTSLEFICTTVSPSVHRASILVYNSSSGYFKRIPLEPSPLIKAIIPELGGMSFIERYCDIHKGNIPSRYKTVDSFITSSIVSVVHEEYRNLPPLKGQFGVGMHFIDGKSVFNGGNEVYGVPNGRSYKGYVFNNDTVSYKIPLTKPTRKDIREKLSKMISVLNGFFESEKDSTIFALMLAGSLLSPLLSHSEKIVLAIEKASVYADTDVKDCIFSSLFSTSLVSSGILSTSALEKIVDKNTVPVVITSVTKNRRAIETIASSRHVSNRTKRNMIGAPDVDSSPSAPMVIISDGVVDINSSAVMRFTLKDVLSFNRLEEPKDVSADIVSYILGSASALRRLDDEVYGILKKKVDAVPDAMIDEYMDLFRRILPAMVLAQHSGFMSAEDFHALAFGKYFDEGENSLKSNIVPIILSTPLKGGITLMSKAVDPSIELPKEIEEYGFISKISHIKTSSKTNSRTFVLLFNIKKMHSIIEERIRVDYHTFRKAVLEHKRSLPKVIASCNYRLHPGKKISVMAKYKEIHGDSTDEFAAIRFSESDNFLLSKAKF